MLGLCNLFSYADSLFVAEAVNVHNRPFIIRSIGVTISSELNCSHLQAIVAGAINWITMFSSPKQCRHLSSSTNSCEIFMISALITNRTTYNRFINIFPNWFCFHTLHSECRSFTFSGSRFVPHRRPTVASLIQKYPEIDSIHWKLIENADIQKWNWNSHSGIFYGECYRASASASEKGKWYANFAAKLCSLRIIN